jgi:hypothetical protein
MGQEFVVATAWNPPKLADANTAAEFERRVRDVYDQQARVAIAPMWARFYDFSAGRLPRSLQAFLDRKQS